MSKTKGGYVTQAYQRIRISGLTVKAVPEETEVGLSVLEDMMYELKSRNICSTYVFEDEPDTKTEAEINPAYNNAVSSNLAIRLIDYFGKEPPQNLYRQAVQSLSNWSARSAKVRQIDPPRRQPRGSGNTFRFQNWARYYRFDNDAPISCSTLSIKVDEVNGFGISFEGYLLEGETITNYTVESDGKIDVLDSAIDGNMIILNCKGVKCGYSPATITITTSNQRVNPEIVNFNVTQ